MNALLWSSRWEQAYFLPNWSGAVEGGGRGALGFNLNVAPQAARG